MNPLPKQKSFLGWFPAPEFLLLSTAGIAITDDSIRFMQFRRQIFGGGFKLANAKRLENPKGSVELGLIADPTGAVSVLKGLASRYGIDYVHATLSEEQAYLFTATIARVPPEGLRDAVAFIIEENVPVSLSESVFDFEIIGDDDGESEIKIVVSVLPKSVVKAYVDLFESAGITPISFDLESQAIARAVIPRGDKQVSLIINISLEKTGFYVVDEEVVQFSSTSAYGVGGDDSYPSLNDLKAEIRKVLAFWDARIDKAGNVSKKIEKAILCGLGAGKRDFVEKFMNESGIEYTLADVWVNTSSSDNHISVISFEESLDYASAIGLALFPGN